MGEYFDWYDKNPDESSSLTVQFSKLMKVRKVIANEKVKQTIDFAENILNKNKGEGITKEGAAIVLPPYEDIKLGTTKYDFISLKEFADNYIDCSK